MSTPEKVEYAYKLMYHVPEPGFEIVQVSLFPFLYGRHVYLEREGWEPERT